MCYTAPAAMYTLCGSMIETPCPLCQRRGAKPYHRDKRRQYWQCPDCQLVFVQPSQRLCKEREKAEYDLHQNSPDDQGYRKFLSRLQQPLLERIKPGARGLDFGCGPGPTLSAMFEESDYKINLYDIFYAPDQRALEQQYHFITATEVIEHLFKPGAVLQQLWQLLLPGGTLGIMTKMISSQQAFTRWHYKNDPTHVCFFSPDSFSWLATTLNAELEIIGQDVILLTRQDC